MRVSNYLRLLGDDISGLQKFFFEAEVASFVCAVVAILIKQNMTNRKTTVEKGTKFAPAGPYYCVGFYTMLAALSFTQTHSAFLRLQIFLLLLRGF